jgi:hypothetical protein
MSRIETGAAARRLFPMRKPALRERGYSEGRRNALPFACPGLVY